MLVMKVGDLDQPVPTPHSPTSKGQRWGNIRQRLSSISNKDGIDDAMWDKNDTAFLEEVARNSPLLVSNTFDTVAPLESAFARRSSFSQLRASFSRPDSEQLHQLQLQQARSSSSTTSSLASPSSASEDASSIKLWAKAPKRRPSATALPGLPEQPRVEPLDTSNTASSSQRFVQGLSSPISPSSKNSFRSSPASSWGEIDPHFPRLVLQDQYPRSPSLDDSPSLPMAGFTSRTADDRGAELDLHSRSLEAALHGVPSDVVEERTTSGPLPVDFKQGDQCVSTLLAPVEDESLTRQHVQDGDHAKQGVTHHVRAYSPVSSPRQHSAIWEANVAHLKGATGSNPLSPLGRDQFNPFPKAQDAEQNSGSVTLAASGQSHYRKHGRSGSSLVAGLKKLMGKREKERELRADGLPLSPTLSSNEFRQPGPVQGAPAPRIVHKDIQVVGLTDLDSNQIQGLNLIGFSPSSASPSGANHSNRFGTSPGSARRSSSVDMLRSFAGLSSSPASAGPSARPDTNAFSSWIASHNRTKSSEGTIHPIRTSISQRIRTQSTASMTRGAARASVIEHISFDQARKTTGSSGPIILRSKESLEEIRSDAKQAEAGLLSSVRSPTRPKRPHSGHSSNLTVDSHLSTASGSNEGSRPSPVWPNFQSQAYKPPTKDSSSTRLSSRHKSPPSSPSIMSFGSVDIGDQASTRTGSSGVDGSKFGHHSRRSLNSLPSRPWSNLLGSPILSSSASSSSHAKRFSTASISRPLSVSSSAFSDTNDIASDMEDLTIVQGAPLTSRRQYDSQASESPLHQTQVLPDEFQPQHQHALSPQSWQQQQNIAARYHRGARMRKISADLRRPMTSGSVTPSSPSLVSDESTLSRSLSMKGFHDGQDFLHRPTSSYSLGHRKRPSFGLAIEPNASSAFDSIPSPLLRTRRGSANTASSEHPSSPRRKYQAQEEADVELLSDHPAIAAPMVIAEEGPGHIAGIETGLGPPALQVDAPVSSPLVPKHFVHSVNEEGNKGKLSQATKDIAFGSIAGMVAKYFEHPFDLVKVRLQTQAADQPPRYKGAFDCFRQTYVKEGIRGLYRGISMPVFGATLENACLFFTYNRVQSIIRDVTGRTAGSQSSLQADAEAPLSMAQLAIAAAGAGSVTSFVLTPVELIKCKMQVQMIAEEQKLLAEKAAGKATASSMSRAAQFRNLEGPVTILRRTLRTDGFRGLWLGQTGTLLRETGGGIAWFLAFEKASRYLIEGKKRATGRSDVTKKDLSSLELIGAGALAGVSYNVVLFPADSVKSTMQTEMELRAKPKPGEAPRPPTGFFQTFKNIYRSRGVRGLYAGCGVTCLRSAPSSALIFLMYNKLEQAAESYGL